MDRNVNPIKLPIATKAGAPSQYVGWVGGETHYLSRTRAAATHKGSVFVSSAWTNLPFSAKRGAAMFMRVTDRETGEEFHLDLTDELNADLSLHPRSECNHPSSEIRRTVVSGGAIHFRHQCTTCGELVGQAIGKTQVPDSCELVDEMLSQSYRAQRQRQYADIIQSHVQRQKNESSQWWTRYNAYLQKAEWRDIRVRVFKRAGGVCEGCGQTRPTQIHHRSYDHVFHEFLFELVAVCDGCHNRLHEDPKADEWRDGFPCEACRFQDEKDHRRWCGKFDVLAVNALAPSGKCGPTHAELEPLK
jgi:hypothetical protein